MHGSSFKTLVKMESISSTNIPGKWALIIQTFMHIYDHVTLQSNPIELYDVARFWKVGYKCV